MVRGEWARIVAVENVFGPKARAHAARPPNFVFDRRRHIPWRRYEGRSSSRVALVNNHRPSHVECLRVVRVGVGNGEAHLDTLCHECLHRQVEPVACRGTSWDAYSTATAQQKSIRLIIVPLDTEYAGLDVHSSAPQIVFCADFVAPDRVRGEHVWTPTGQRRGDRCAAVALRDRQVEKVVLVGLVGKAVSWRNPGFGSFGAEDRRSFGDGFIFPASNTQSGARGKPLREPESDLPKTFELSLIDHGRIRVFHCTHSRDDTAVGAVENANATVIDQTQ